MQAEASRGTEDGALVELEASSSVTRRADSPDRDVTATVTEAVRVRLGTLIVSLPVALTLKVFSHDHHWLALKARGLGAREGGRLCR